MDDPKLAILVSTATGFTLLLSAAILFLVFRARRARLAEPPQTNADGATSFPVRGIYTQSGLFGGAARNSINPLFAVGRGGIDLRVIRRHHLDFAEIAQADVRKTLTGHALILKATDGRVFAMRFGDADQVRRVLKTLPAAAGIPITEEAATLCDGNPSAGTPGLSRYRGPLQ